MRLFFEPTPFYVEAHEATLPDVETLTKYFITQFYPYYKQLSIRVDESYKIRQNNLLVSYGGKGRVRKTLDTEQYEAIHADHLKLGSYYSLLLTATRRKYGIWLNDLIPAK